MLFFTYLSSVAMLLQLKTNIMSDFFISENGDLQHEQAPENLKIVGLAVSIWGLVGLCVEPID